MSRILNFIRTEPALIMGVLSAALGLLLATGVHLSTDQTGVIEAVVAAALGLVVAAATRPFQVSALTGLMSAIGTLLVTFGVHKFTAGDVSAVNAFIVSIFAVLVRLHVTPVASLNAGVKRAASM